MKQWTMPMQEVCKSWLDVPSFLVLHRTFCRCCLRWISLATERSFAWLECCSAARPLRLACLSGTSARTCFLVSIRKQRPTDQESGLRSSFNLSVWSHRHFSVASFLQQCAFWLVVIFWRPFRALEWKRHTAFWPSTVTSIGYGSLSGKRLKPLDATEWKLSPERTNKHVEWMRF